MYELGGGDKIQLITPTWIIIKNIRPFSFGFAWFSSTAPSKEHQVLSQRINAMLTVLVLLSGFIYDV